MGLLGIFGETPKQNFVGVSPEAEQMIQSGVERANRDQGAFAADLNRGINDPGTEPQAQPSMDSPFAMALRNKYATMASDSINRLKSQNAYKASLNKGNEMAGMSRVKLAQERVKVMNYEALTQAYNQQEMARAQFIGQLFQLGGSAMSVGLANRGAVKPNNDLKTGTPTVGSWGPSSGTSQGYGTDYGSIA